MLVDEKFFLARKMKPSYLATDEAEENIFVAFQPCSSSVCGLVSLRALGVIEKIMKLELNK